MKHPADFIIGLFFGILFSIITILLALKLIKIATTKRVVGYDFGDTRAAFLEAK